MNCEIELLDDETSAKENKLIELMINVGRAQNNFTLQRYYFDLMDLEKNPLSLTDIIFNLLTENSTANRVVNLNENDQLSFLIYFKNWVNKLLQIDKAVYIKNLSDKICKLITIFFSEKLHEKNTHIFEEIFVTLFNLMKNNKEISSDSNNINVFVYQIFNLLKEEILTNQDIQYYKIKSILILLQALAFFHSELVTISYELSEYYNLLLKILEKINTYNLGTIFNTKISILNYITGTFCKISNKILNETFKKEEILKYTSIIKENRENECFINNEYFTMFIRKVVKMNRNFNEDTEIFSSIFIIDEDDQYHGINTSKSNIIELVTMITEYITNKNIFENMENFKTLHTNLFIDTLKALGEYNRINYNYKYYNNIIEKSNNSESEMIILKYLSRIINFLTVSIKTRIGEEFYLQNKIDILQFIILPSLRITPLEKDLFLIDAEEFLKSTLDMTSKQHTNQPKHKMMKFIDMLCENVDSFTKLITEFYIDILFYIVYKNNTCLNADNNFTILHYMPLGFQEYLKSVPDEDLLEQALQVLSSISYLIYENRKLQSLLEDKIELINHILIKIQDEFIMAKLCNFYAYCLDDLFHDHKQILSKSFDDSLHFMFNCLISQNKNISLNFMALESIHSLIFTDDMKVVVTDTVKLFIKDVLCMIEIPHFKDLTNNCIFHKFVKFLLSRFFKDIETNITYIFSYFWRDILVAIEMIKSGKESGNTSNQYVLKEKNFNLLENLHNLKALIKDCNERLQNFEAKSVIYETILSTLLNQLDKIINHDYEEDFLEIISLILNDIKLVPINFSLELHKLIDNLLNNYKLKFESYHIDFIFNFLKNLRREDYILYKIKLFELISKRLIFVEKSTSVMKILNDHINITTLLNVFIMFYWDELNIDDYFSILNLVTKRLGIQPISDEIFVGKLCLNFFLVVIKLDLIGCLKELKNYQNLEILIVKTITFPNTEDSIEENSISAIFASKIVLFLFTENYNIIQNFRDNFQDNSIMNFIIHLINFNIDQLIHLRKKSIDSDKTEKKNKIENEVKKKKNMKKNSSELESESESGSEENYINNKENSYLNFKSSCYSESDSDEIISNDEDAIDRIINEKENLSDKDDDFLKIKRKPHYEFNKYVKNYSSPDLTKVLNKLDEFQIFNDLLNFISNTNEEVYLHIISTFTKTKINLVETIRKFRKIISTDVSNISILPKFRKIVKIKFNK